MRSLRHPARVTPARLALALLALAGAAPAQVEVPAILNTYRVAIPSAAEPYAAGFAQRQIALSGRQIRELYYESFIDGPMQGEPDPTGSFGVAADGVTAYTTLAAAGNPKDRLPAMPIVPDPVTGELILHLRIHKLPTRYACQKIVNHMMLMGLLPGYDGDNELLPDDIDPRQQPYAQATGRWRLLIHPPRGKGAPPAPSLFYPEAIQRIRPTAPNDTDDNWRRPRTVFRDAAYAIGGAAAGSAIFGDFWGNLAFRWREWDEWIRPIYLSLANDQNDCKNPASAAAGVVPIPIFMANPIDYVTYAEGRTDDGQRTNCDDATTFKDKLAFFDPAAMWENRLLDPNFEAPSDDELPQPLTDNGDTTRQRPGDFGDYPLGEQNRPLELILHAFDERGTDGIRGVGTDDWVYETELAADADNLENPRQWCLKGVNTTGPDRLNSGGSGAYDPLQDPLFLGDLAKPAVGAGTDPDFVVPAQPFELTINLSTGAWTVHNEASTGADRTGTAPNLPPFTAGVGMIELQFEYETFVPALAVTNQQGRSWDNSTPNNSEIRDLNGNGAGPYVVLPLRQNDTDGGTIQHTYDVFPVMDAGATSGADYNQGNAEQLVRDPLDILRTQNVRDPGDAQSVYLGAGRTKGGWWKIRRYSGWPYHRALLNEASDPPAAVDDPAAAPTYQGGPIVCRFVVSPLRAVPEELHTAGVTSPNLSQLAEYDPAGGLYYPQLGAVRAFDPTLQELDRPNYLFGYRADDADASSPNQDYHFPFLPGSRTEEHRFWLKTVLDYLPGGSLHVWTDPEQASAPAWASSSSGDPNATGSGWALRGSSDLRTRQAAGDYRPRYLAYDLSAINVPGEANAAIRASAMMYALDIPGTHNASGPTNQTYINDGTSGNGVSIDDAGLWDARAAFDGDTGTGVDVPASKVGGTAVGYSIGVRFDQPQLVSSVRFHANDNATWRVQFLYGTPPDLDWYWDDAAIAVTAAPQWVSHTPVWSDVVYGVRLVNQTGATARLNELQVTSTDAMGRGVLRAASVNRASSDSAIGASPIPESAVTIKKASDRTFTAGDVIESQLAVAIPAYQPPSTDSIERQLLADVGAISPSTYETRSQPSGAPNALWDRYRGEAVAFIDDLGTQTRTLDTVGAFNRAGRWDVSLYRVGSRSAFPAGLPENLTQTYTQPVCYQFNGWYEEDSGWVGAGTYNNGAGSVTSARLSGSGTGQRVALEPYTTFDFELSVAYLRRLRISENLLDFGKVLHGGVSQWVPVTLTNEGNVPLRAVRLYIDRPLAPVGLNDQAALSAARLAQSQVVPAWRADVALHATATTEDGTSELAQLTATSYRRDIGDIPAAPVGSATGQAATEVWLRVGRLDATNPVDDRRVPLGQPLGNYVGRIRVFVDNLGLAAADVNRTGANDLDGIPDADEVELGDTATMKLSVIESPLWRIGDFYDNDVDRNTRSADPLNTMPYNGNTGQGTYQPLPAFDHLYSDPNAAAATPTVVVVQDPSEFSANPPNASDNLWFGWSELRNDARGNGWVVHYVDAARPTFTSNNNILQANYRSFLFSTSNNLSWITPTVARSRSLYPAVCVVPETTAGSRQFVLLWHMDFEDPSTGGRSSYLQFRRVQQGQPFGPTLQIPDDTSTDGPRLSKQVPRALIDDINGQKVMWVVWQSTGTDRPRLGFNAIRLPAAYNATTGYYDAIKTTNTYTNYTLRTPPGLTNVSEPALPAYRQDPVNPNVTVLGDLRPLNVLYSAWSPVWQNQDIYWSRYQAVENPALLTDLASPTLTDGLRRSPMAENAYRVNQLQTAGGAPLNYPGRNSPGYWVRSQPGGRVPFPRVTGELLQSNANHTMYAAAHIDWIMPPDRFRLSGPVTDAGGTVRWAVEETTHRGFADTDQPLFDQDRYATLQAGTANADLDPVVVLRVQQGASLTAAPTTSPATQASRVDFDLERAYWDTTTDEWVLPITAPAFLLNRGVVSCRIHPGLGRVTFNKPLWRRGTDTPIYVFATYRPCCWRLTDDPAVDAQPTAAFDWWERLTVVWRRTIEGGKGELWYRTFSLAVPLERAPVTRLRAVVNDADAAAGEGTPVYNGSVPGGDQTNATISRWSFTGMSGGNIQAAAGAWSELAQAATATTFQLTAFGSLTGDSAQNNVDVGARAAAMVHFGFDDIGRRVRVWYNTPLSANPVTEAHVVPGLGPERLVPLDGAVNESQPSLSPEHFYVGYTLPNGTVTSIMSTRLWLAWISTRDLFVPTAGTPQRGAAGTNVFYGAFLPHHAASTVSER